MKKDYGQQTNLMHYINAEFPEFNHSGYLKYLFLQNAYEMY